MTWKPGSWLLVVSSAVVSFLLVELFYQLLSPAPADVGSRMLQRIVFFDGRGSIFENRDGTFTYVPHNDVRIVTAFFSERDFTVEYDLRITTNNFGLMQGADIAPERPSLLLLGDSSTEGLGAEPWFRLVHPAVAEHGYQAINGGLRCSGFQHWLKLQGLLVAGNIQVKKPVVVFISDDFQRPLSEIKPQELRCLASLSQCPFGEGYHFRLPPEGELAVWIDEIPTARAPMLRAGSSSRARFEALLPVSYHAYKYVKQRLMLPGADARPVGAAAEARAVIVDLLATYGRDNAMFVHVPQGNETASVRPIELGRAVRRAIEEAGGRPIDGFKLCRLTPADYYRNDDHPNAAGYAKIAACAGTAINDFLAGTQ